MWLLSLLAICALRSLAAGPVTEDSSPPYTSESGQCRKNDAEYYNEDIKKCCRKCPPGFFQDEECNESKNTKCKACREKTYTELWNYHRHCFQCIACKGGTKEVAPCTTSSRRQCQCPEDSYCATWQSPSCYRCSLLSKCPPGQGANPAGNVLTNTVCSDCPPGTFSSSLSSTEACRPHTICSDHGRTLLLPGNSTSDATCGELVTTLPVLIRTRRLPENSVPAVKSGKLVTRVPPLSTDQLQPPEGTTVILQSVKNVNSSTPSLVLYLSLSGVVILLVAIVTVLITKSCKLTGKKEKADGEAQQPPSAQSSPDGGQRCSSLVTASGQEKQCLLEDHNSSNHSISSSATSSSSSGTNVPNCCHEQDSVATERYQQIGTQRQNSDGTTGTNACVSVHIKAIINCRHGTSLIHKDCPAGPSETCSCSQESQYGEQDQDSVVHLSQEESYVSLMDPQQHTDKDARLAVQEADPKGLLS
ncbi:tumor necrosis factor receptor superfamily member 1B-like isoform X1 [Polypterus senegalus]|uniref:tumor necrosis factor receptor superfamily member 1B-like isoform X1 n=1 Tax=Polypterus senegalus TaxID=55291 RepID=UPI0019651950|nr:tumor necrosis factor receptor superfamily member 1B-like isoform X1 [Polypterus senegalus]